VDETFGVNGSSLVVYGNMINCVAQITGGVRCIVSNQSRSHFVSVFPNGTLDQDTSASFSSYSTDRGVDGLIRAGVPQTLAGDLWYFTTSFNDTIRAARRWLLPQFLPSWSPQLTLPTRPTSARLLVADVNVRTRLFVGAQNADSSFAIAAIFSSSGALDSSFGQDRGFVVPTRSSTNDRIQLRDTLPLVTGSFSCLIAFNHHLMTRVHHRNGDRVHCLQRLFQHASHLSAAQMARRDD
jgi:hypothetical protein